MSLLDRLTDQTPLSLTHYLSAVKSSIHEQFDRDVWLVCEIRAVNSKGGHYYFELADKDANGQVSASCRGTLWRFVAERVIKKFEQNTNTKLTSGIKVLINGRATFHAQYGFSFNINDIDPNYTLGELAAAYQAMQQKLADNGLLTQNKSRPMPFDLQNIIVIAPENAAGLGDFRAEADGLAQTGACAFFYHFATFQGNTAPTDIRVTFANALETFLNQYNQLPDLMVIIRGGGAVGDLAYLNDYELSAMIAECPVPVWVGIGHERDKVILDEVAHTRFDTPSKVILGIKDFLAHRWGMASKYFAQTKTIAHSRLQHSHFETAALFSRLHKASLLYLQQEKFNLTKIINHLQKDSFRQLTHTKNAIRHYHALTLTYHPIHHLNQGYAIVKKDHKPIQNIDKINDDDELTIILKDGELKVKVLSKNF